jgi:transposase
VESRPDRAYTVMGSQYGDVKQRWRVVYTRVAHERAEQSVNRQHLKQSQTEYNALSTLAKQRFACTADAEIALARFQKTLNTPQLHDTRMIEAHPLTGKGRPRKGRVPDTVLYRIEADIASIIETRQHKVKQKGCFIPATHQLDESQLSDADIVDHYTPGQQKVERGFRFLKDPWFMANTLFLKSPKRIMALMVIMTLCLWVYSALAFRIRQALVQQQESFPNQIGNMTVKPTARWVFQFFAGIHVLLIGHVQSLVLNCNEHHKQALTLLGDRYVRLYSNSG